MMTMVKLRDDVTKTRLPESAVDVALLNIRARLQAEGFVLINDCVVCETIHDANRVLMVWREEFTKVEG